jgi:prepilin-type N-terminal cleavage/methylation domain-containing protein
MKRLWVSSNAYGFTVLEILVAVVVIGILASVTLVSYDGIQQRSRDTTRENDITQLRIGLDKYYAANSEFPAVCAADGTPCPAIDLSTALDPYMDTIPRDPTAEGTSDDYQYVRGDPGNRYGLRVVYEERETCKVGVLVNSAWWGGLQEC